MALAQLLFNRLILAKECKAAVWNENSESYGTPVLSKALQGFEINPTYDTDQKPVGGAIEHVLTVMTGAELKFSNLGMDQLWLEVVTPMTSTLSGSGSSGKRTIVVPTGSNFPYFGIIVKYMIDGGGDIHIGFPRCKLTKALDLKVGETSEFAVPEMEAMAARLRLDSDTLVNAMVMERNGTEQTISSDFDAWFGV